MSFINCNIAFIKLYSLFLRIPLGRYAFPFSCLFFFYFLSIFSSRYIVYRIIILPFSFSKILLCRLYSSCLIARSCCYLSCNLSLLSLFHSVTVCNHPLAFHLLIASSSPFLIQIRVSLLPRWNYVKKDTMAIFVHARCNHTLAFLFLRSFISSFLFLLHSFSFAFGSLTTLCCVHLVWGGTPLRLQLASDRTAASHCARFTEYTPCLSGGNMMALSWSSCRRNFISLFYSLCFVNDAFRLSASWILRNFHVLMFQRILFTFPLSSFPCRTEGNTRLNT